MVDRLDATLAEDFNTRESIALLFGWTKRLSELSGALDAIAGPDLERLRAPYDWAREVLGLFDDRSSHGEGAWGEVVEVALAARARARARGDFAESDRIRDELKTAGIEVEDGAGRSRWRRSGPG